MISSSDRRGSRGVQEDVQGQPLRERAVPGFILSDGKMFIYSEATLTTMLLRLPEESLHLLVSVTVQEHRVSLRLLLLKVFGAMCSLDAALISTLLNSILPMELARDLQTDTQGATLHSVPPLPCRLSPLAKYKPELPACPFLRTPEDVLHSFSADNDLLHGRAGAISSLWCVTCNPNQRNNASVPFLVRLMTPTAFRTFECCVCGVSSGCGGGRASLRSHRATSRHLSEPGVVLQPASHR